VEEKEEKVEEGARAVGRELRGRGGREGEKFNQ